jgi:1,4-dihydroxy-2-naphthoate octaprenyltransferase
MNIPAWISAFRLRTLPLALASIGMGSFLAAAAGKFRIDVLLLAGLTTIFLQILSNLANDYGDTRNGADSRHRVGPVRAVQSGAISIVAMKSGIVVFAILSFSSGLLLLYSSIGLSGKVFLLFLGLGLASIGAAYAYTAGSRPYGYMGLGDLFVLIFFGFVGVGGTYYLHTSELDPGILLPTLATGMFATAVLNVNNIRDIDSDRQAGKMSIPVRLGRDKAVVYHWVLLILGMIVAAVYIYQLPFNPSRLLFLISYPLFVINGLAVQRKTGPGEIDPYLKQLALSALLFMILFGCSILW